MVILVTEGSGNIIVTKAVIEGWNLRKRPLRQYKEQSKKSNI